MTANHPAHPDLKDFIPRGPIEKALLGIIAELEARTPAHEFTGTVKRADGIIVTATLTVPDGHPAVSPEPLRPWHGTDRTNQNFLELGELAMMIAQRGYSIVESNERSRESWGKQDYWADLLDITPPTPAIEQ